MSHNFEPENLDETFIDEIYEECLTDNKHLHIPVEVLRPDTVEKRSGVTFIDPIILAKYAEHIDYMFGQIRAFHDIRKPYMSFQEGYINYLDAYWTEDLETILKLYTLGIANETIHPFALSRNRMIVARKDSLVIPTLDTFDPKFPEWFETVYKKEYKPRHKIDGE